MTLRTDVLVVGAGPAGSAAAVGLARAGQAVTVIDKARFPRDKICGDGLTAAALHHLDALGLDPAGLPSWQQVSDIRVATPTGRVTTFPFPRGRGTYAAAVRRVELDAALVARARSAGATVHESAPLLSIHDRGDDVLARVEGVGEVQARYVVAADGMWSPVRKCLGVSIPGYRGECHAFRQYLRGVGPSARDALWVWFEPDVVPGYAWSFPLGDGSVNVGFGIHRDGRMAVRDMAAAWRTMLRRPGIAEVLGDGWEAEGPHRAWPIPARVDGIPLTHGRALFVGDAAAATDPLTGEGIGQALETGVLAAEAIVAAGPRGAATAAGRYEREVARGLARDNRMARWLLPIVARRRGAEAAVRVAGATDWTRRSFARWLFEDYPRAVLLTPHRWHRDVFTGPGAFT